MGAVRRAGGCAGLIRSRGRRVCIGIGMGRPRRDPAQQIVATDHARPAAGQLAIMREIVLGIALGRIRYQFDIDPGALLLTHTPPGIHGDRQDKQAAYKHHGIAQIQFRHGRLPSLLPSLTPAHSSAAQGGRDQVAASSAASSTSTETRRDTPGSCIVTPIR